MSVAMEVYAVHKIGPYIKSYKMFIRDKVRWQVGTFLVLGHEIAQLRNFFHTVSFCLASLQ